MARSGLEDRRPASLWGILLLIRLPAQEVEDLCRPLLGGAARSGSSRGGRSLALVGGAVAGNVASAIHSEAAVVVGRYYDRFKAT